MIPVILSGGSGSRLWPLSRQHCPKQFLAIHTEKTLFQETVTRLKNLNLSKPIVVCNENHRFTVANNIQQISCEAHDIILEPLARNTAPAIAVAALSAIQHEDDPVILVLPADHAIENEEALAHSFRVAETLAQKGYLVTFGVKPTKPHTGYGYIKLGQNLQDDAHIIESFIEKPDEQKAIALLEQGGSLWNSGMFCFKAKRYLEELQKFYPDIVTYAKNAVANAEKDYDFLRLSKKEFSQCESISIDYAVMENTDKGCVVSIDADWSDIGSWDAVWQISDKDENNNVCSNDVIALDSKNSYIYSKDKLVVTIGVNNLMVIDTADAILVADKEKTQEVKTVVEILKSKDRKEAQTHARVDRPWGFYDLLLDDNNSEIKKLNLNKKAKISLQQHQHRSEHWVIINGKAKVVLDDETIFLTSNQSIYIPENVRHSIENVGNSDLVLIEVRTGNVIDESDIIRVES